MKVRIIGTEKKTNSVTRTNKNREHFGGYRIKAAMRQPLNRMGSAIWLKPNGLNPQINLKQCGVMP